MGFEKFNLNENILDTLKKCGFTVPTEIQEKVIPLANANKNILGKSPTGTGKTHAFLLPILNKIDPTINKVQAIILSPTRELAKQIMLMIKPFLENGSNIKAVLLSSGSDRNNDISSVQKAPHIVIGTPGRIKDIAFDNALFNITTAKVCVIDEADMILETGFLDEVGVILGKLKKDTQLMCFSATLPENLLQFLYSYIKQPEFVDIDKQSLTSKTVEHVAYPTRNKNKLEVLKYLINVTNPFTVIIFASKKETVNKIYKYLREQDYKCCILHGDLSSTIRKTTMNRIRNNEFSIIVASDMMARGLDIEGVSEVINYDLPYEEEFYFHRAGRCGRNNQTGVCYTLYDKEEVDVLKNFFNKGVKFVNKEYKDGNWVNLKPLFTQKRKTKESPVNSEIKRISNQTKKAKVKPNYKKKAKQEIEKVKRKHKRETIKKDIERQKLERYKAQSREKRMNGEING